MSPSGGREWRPYNLPTPRTSATRTTTVLTTDRKLWTTYGFVMSSRRLHGRWSVSLVWLKGVGELPIEIGQHLPHHPDRLSGDRVEDELQMRRTHRGQPTHVVG